jgi:hypothetical protein
MENISNYAYFQRPSSLFYKYFQKKFGGTVTFLYVYKNLPQISNVINKYIILNCHCHGTTSVVGTTLHRACIIIRLLEKTKQNQTRKKQGAA